MSPKASIASIARKLGYDRTTVYQHFKNDELEYSTILKYGKALKHDFTLEFPEMLQFISTLEEPISEYRATTVSEALKERDYWKDKYIALMEKHNEFIMNHLVKSS
ncbi:hypothetical protein [Pedobacter antarcticus]|uniref:hypothetical protein n=1 Tax=Pedobacter antarcticus TaxID=34086 RepID=UPI00292E8B82|nr:hypothetical protein [Pedobacter antarcticus]